MKRALLFLLFWSWVNPIYSQNPLLPQTLLWEVKGNGLKSPSYVFGTMHLLCKEDAILGDSLQYTIKNCDAVYFEIDMDDMFQMMGMIRHLNMRGDTSLDQLLSDKDYLKLEAFIRKARLPIPMSMLRKMKPMFVSGLLSESLFECTQKNGMEELIMKSAKRQGKQIKGLETASFQAGLFDSIPYQIQALELLEFTDSIESVKLSTYKMVEYYKSQDLENLLLITTESEPGLENYMDLLLYKRNRNWVSKFDSIAVKESCLIAVGAGHLPGKNGLLELLRAKGYEVRPVVNTIKKGAMVALTP
jgi:uncharacterized protein YbaP (TraB family)